MGKAEFRIVPGSGAAIGSILYKGMLVEFAIDAADVEAVKQHKWHLSSNSSIATTIRQDASGQDAAAAAAAPKKRELHLHNFLCRPPPGSVVIHRSRNCLDNRRQNLRILPEAEAAILLNASQIKKRSTQLPPLCGLTPEDIPRHIWYVQANGYHRDRFAIEFKTEGILWKSTSSKQVALKEKLEQAKAKLAELYQLHPHLDPSAEEAAGAANQASFEKLLSFQQSTQTSG